MAKRPRRNHGAAFKAKAALEALKGEQVLVELAVRFRVRTNQITEWKKHLLDRALEIFDKERNTSEPDIKELHAKIGQLAMENDFFVHRARGRRRTERKEMINREHTVPITTQCKILNLSRSGVYYIPVLVRDKDRELMGLIDNIHLDELYLGTRGIRDALLERGRKIGRSHVRTLMRKMGIEALYQKP